MLSGRTVGPPSRQSFLLPSYCAKLYKINSEFVRCPPLYSTVSEESQLELVASPTQYFDPATLFAEARDVVEDSPIIAVFDREELSFELGVWLAGLESFLAIGSNVFGDKNASADLSRDWERECRLTCTALLHCSKVNFRLRKEVDSESGAGQAGLNARELDAFAIVLRDAIVLNERVLASGDLNFGDWRTWSAALNEELTSSAAHRKLVNCTRALGESFLPPKLKTLLVEKEIPFADEVDLHVILPQFGTILGSLNVVGRMLENDEPLKPSLIIFSSVYEQTNDLISHINNRLSRFPNEGAAMFDSLDGASYTAALELKKVFAHELTGLVMLRPVPSVFARVETAFELLSDSFRQILVGFARVIDPNIKAFDLFPKYQTKLEQSIALRQHLWEVLKHVRAAEQSPDKKLLEAANKRLLAFLEETVSFLFHKDRETLERFAEEIFVTSEKKDIVPILHRFGAYIETLMSQVNMRTVLAHHPFDPEEN